MKNYLKKAISAVIALALAASMVPATFAASLVLTDVPETANYATAVNTLVALGVVNGYEDNTFKPDNNITRAEASKIIVAALNETASAEAMKGATKFSDIEAKHEWATGYINKGVSMGYINGMENNQFQPDGNVTFAQVVKMMLCAMGYEDYAASLAEQYGYTGANWYIPYTQLAAEAGVTEGVSAGPNEAVTRAQVAQLVYNAVKAPIVKNVGITYTDSGKIVPRIQIQDGSGSGSDKVYFKSILTEKFDAFYVEGYVLDTVKTLKNSLEADEVKFGIAKSKFYANEEVQLEKALRSVAEVRTENVVLDVVNVGDTNAAAGINVYASAIVMVDDYDDWKLISFTPSGKNKSVTLDLSLIYAAGSDENTLEFYTDETESDTEEYDLGAASNADKNTKVYVNGFYAGLANAMEDGQKIINKYVTTQENGTITLVDTYKTNGTFDTIFVDSYYTDMVTAVAEDSIIMTTATLDLDTEVNDDLEYHIYYNGEEITLADVKEDDVLSIAYDIDENIEDSNYYEIYVSREVVSGTLRKLPDMAAVIEDTEYKFATTSDYNSFKNDFTVGDKARVYVDYFGKVFDWEIDESSANYAIVERVYFESSSAYDDPRITLVTADGAKKVYDIDYKKAKVEKANGSAITGTTAADLSDKLKAEVYSNGELVAIQNRVVTYTISASTGKISKLNFVAVADNNSGSAVEYDIDRTKIGTIRMNDATKIMDATAYVEDEIISAATLDVLNDGVEYKAFAYGRKVANAYPFVLITEGAAAYGLETRFAVVIEDGAAPVLVDGEEGFFEIEALYGSKDIVKLVATDDDEATLTDLVAGDVIFFRTNAAGHIKDVDVIFHFDADAIPTYANLAAWSLANNNEDNNVSNITITSTGTNFGSNVFTQDWDADDRETVKFVYGPIAEVSKNSISIAKVVNGETDLDTDVEEFDIASEINVYKYDFGSKAKNKFSATVQTTGAAIVAPQYLTKLIEDNDDVIDWDDADAKHNEKANFVFALVVEGEVVEVFEFIAD